MRIWGFIAAVFMIIVGILNIILEIMLLTSVAAVSAVIAFYLIAGGVNLLFLTINAKNLKG